MRKLWNNTGGAIWRCLNRLVSGIDCSYESNKYDYAEMVGLLALLSVVVVMVCLWVFVSGFSAGVWLGVMTCKAESWIVRPINKFFFR
jgi:hypothetical protein